MIEDVLQKLQWAGNYTPADVKYIILWASAREKISPWRYILAKKEVSFKWFQNETIGIYSQYHRHDVDWTLVLEDGMAITKSGSDTECYRMEEGVVDYEIDDPSTGERLADIIAALWQELAQHDVEK